ncbi:MAG: hypothetical protein H7123_00325, partial [Thermoleophilia bacterium]|nr:hypothetical protein [Thermoleophilia bacterium]
MTTFLRRHVRSRRLLLTFALAVTCAVAVAACSSGRASSTDSAEGIRTGTGWAPQGSLAVVSLDISNAGIDTAIATLERLPSFHLVTAQLPAPHQGAQARQQPVG